MGDHGGFLSGERLVSDIMSLEFQQPAQQNGNRLAGHSTASTAHAPDSSTRRCQECGQVKAIESFDPGHNERVSNHMISTVCRACRRVLVQYIEHQDEIDKERDKLASQVQKLVRQLHGRNLENAPHISEQLDTFLGKLGGLDRLTDDMKAVHEVVMAEGNIAQKQRQIKEITEMIKSSTELRESAPDMANMSDDQVSKLMIHGLMEYLNQIGAKIVFDDGPNSAKRIEGQSQASGAPEDETVDAEISSAGINPEDSGGKNGNFSEVDETPVHDTGYVPQPDDF